ncbi:MAG: PilN domain-containing protein [Planctomycetota bacterium]|jgi:hypothetical protein
MKEIDLLPEWYKNSKRRQVSYNTQYIGVFVLFLIMVMWNFLAAHSVSTAEADLSELEVKKTHVSNVFNKAEKIKQEMMRIKEKAKVLEKVDSRINIAAVLSEISFLLNDHIVLSHFDIKAETFDTEENEKRKSSAVRIARSRQTEKATVHYDNVKFRIVLQGIATNASVVAELICRLEDSAYFFNVMPSFTRNKELPARRNSNVEIDEVSEFEISCYLANYIINESFAGNQGQQGSN